MASIAGAEASNDQPPNIVLILADDAGRECFGCYGGQDYSTPHIDALARSGVRFTHCYSQPLCTPSRVKLMTGQCNIRNYVRFGLMAPNEWTLGHLLRDAGYRTAVFGKWQLYGAEHYGRFAGKGLHPRDAGFDEYCLWQVDRLGSRYWNPLIECSGTPASVKRGEFGPDCFAHAAVDFIERNSKRPFFVYYPSVLPHDPFIRTPDSRIGKNASKKKLFQGMMAAFDKNVGRIVSKLDELDLRKNTLILLTSDNGTHPTISSRFKGGTLRGGKGNTNESGCRVPLIASWPSISPPDTLCEYLIDFSDFVPTLAEVSGASLPEDYSGDGRSFSPQILGKKSEAKGVLTAYYRPRPEKQGKKWREKRFAWNRRWKLYATGDLYDIRLDPHEEHAIPLSNEGPAGRDARLQLQTALATMPKSPLKLDTRSQ